VDLGLLIPDSLILATLGALVLVAGALYALWTSPNWLPRRIGALDRFLTRIGFGSYTARFLTWMENRFGERWGRRDS
jgi:hypothetical protein